MTEVELLNKSEDFLKKYKRLTWKPIDFPEDMTEENRQNVIFRYLAILPESFLNLKTAAEDNSEVISIKWIPTDELDNYNFAWSQRRTIKRILTNSGLGF